MHIGMRKRLSPWPRGHNICGQGPQGTGPHGKRPRHHLASAPDSKTTVLSTVAVTLVRSGCTMAATTPRPHLLEVLQLQLVLLLALRLLQPQLAQRLQGLERRQVCSTHEAMALH